MTYLGEIFTIRKGRKEVKSFENTSLRYIQIDDLRNNDYLKYCVKNLKNVLCDPSDILIAWDGANAGTIGYGLKGAIGSTIAKLSTERKDVFIPYIGKFLQSKSKYLRERCTGATIPHISRNELDKIKIPLPPLEIQKRIAAILDKADELRRNDKKILEKYDQLARSVFLEMFGDPVYNKIKFDYCTIRDLVKEVKYGTSSKASRVGKYTYLRMNNITYSGYLDFSDLKYIDLKEKDKEKYLVKKGDLLFNRTNSKELVGKTAVYGLKEPMAIAGYLIKVRVNSFANPYFIWGYLNSKHGKKTLENMCKSIVGMANINAQELQNIKILKPPIELQDKFAEIIKQIEVQKQVTQQSLQKSEELFQSLLQRAFRGELV